LTDTAPLHDLKFIRDGSISSLFSGFYHCKKTRVLSFEYAVRRATMFSPLIISVIHAKYYNGKFYDEIRFYEACTSNVQKLMC